jgi:DNA-binding IclR family transcriptional regulator
MQERSPYAIATGRAILAHVDEDTLQAVVKRHGMPGEQWDGIRTMRALKSSLKEIRRSGRASCASSRGSVHAVGMPVFGPEKQVWASMGVFLPASRFRGAHKKGIIRELSRAAERMSHILSARRNGSQDSVRNPGSGT